MAIARWGFVAICVVIAVLTIMSGLGVTAPPTPPPDATEAQIAAIQAQTQNWDPGSTLTTTALFYYFSALCALAAGAFTAFLTVRKDGLALSRGANAAYAAGMVAIGFYLAWLGAALIGLGGSWFFLLAGLGMFACAALIILRNRLAPFVYAGIMVIALIYGLIENGLDFISQLPDVAAWVGFGLWFLTPWYANGMRKAPGEAPPKGARWVGFAQIASLALLALAGVQGYSVVEGTKNAPVGEQVADWRNYGNSTGGERFVRLDQITPDNVGKLEKAWEFRTKVAYDFKNTPLQIGDLVYACTAGNQVIAIDATKGNEVWRFDPKSEVPGAQGPRGLAAASTFARTCRGVGYYEAPPEYTGECAKRIITATTAAEMRVLDAGTGEVCRSFGRDGVVNLKSGMGSVNTGEYMVTSAPLIAGDKIVVGGWITDNQQIGNASGVLRAYSVMTGDFVWAWDMGNPGYQGLPDEGGQFTRGTPNVWSNTAYDPELNLIYAPTGNASPDYYGAKRRPFDEAYSAATVAIDANTGVLRWAYQNTHHDIWDYDAPSQPVLVNITKNGQAIPAVAQPTKRGEVFLLDRRTGEPVWPATTCPDGSAADAKGECKVPQGTAKGDFVTATQPFSALPNFRPDRLEKDMWGLTPLDQLWCRVEYKKMRYEGHFTPPMEGGGSFNSNRPSWGGSFQFPGNAGGFNWPSVSVDADSGLLVAMPMLMGNRIYMAPPPQRGPGGPGGPGGPPQGAPGSTTQPSGSPAPPTSPAPSGQVAPPAATPPTGAPPAAPERGRTTPGASRDTGQGAWDGEAPRFGSTSPFMSGWRMPFTKLETGVPCFEPPYGQIAVIDLNTSKLLWKRPIGTLEESGPFGIKMGMPLHVGTAIYGGSMTTRSGLIFQVGTMDSTIRAIDLRTGKVKWSAKMPGTANGTPISYLAKDGKQYVVISVPNPTFVYPRDSGAEPTDDLGGWVIAYKLPDDVAK